MDEALEACIGLLRCIQRFRSIPNEELMGRARERSSDLLHALWAHPEYNAWICGREGSKHLDQLAAIAASQNDDARLALDQHTLRTAIEWQFCHRFLKEGKPVTAQTVDSVLKRATSHALRKRRDGRIAIPCRITDDEDPLEFQIAGILFQRTSVFLSAIPNGDEKQPALLGSASTQLSLQQNPWVAVASYSKLDPSLAREKAFAAVQAALELLAALLDPYRGDRLLTGIVRSRAATNIHFESKDGEDWTVSLVQHSLQTSFGEGWYQYLRDKLGWFLEMGSRAVAGLLMPRDAFPLEQRFLDALHWFGLASRESSPANRIAACVFALERLSMTREVDDRGKTAKAFAQRTVILAREFSGYEAIAWFPRLVDLYDIRSRLAHGDASPTDLRVSSSAGFALGATRSALLGSLSVYAGLSSGLGTDADLRAYFANMAPLD